MSGHHRPCEECDGLGGFKVLPDYDTVNVRYDPSDPSVLECPICNGAGQVRVGHGREPDEAAEELQTKGDDA